MAEPERCYEPLSINGVELRCDKAKGHAGPHDSMFINHEALAAPAVDAKQQAYNESLLSVGRGPHPENHPDEPGQSYRCEIGLHPHPGACVWRKKPSQSVLSKILDWLDKFSIRTDEPF